ncbi:hypothetical protein L249_6787 [Ophiocordyceps polyrhachis-furcata BCC 54312]|uniref:Uncharacterized protein n=1 Tax=Ophiocordyceps polyrhachis-furcata BCC 54312 TaxID=1330021 RepID=A0A367LJU2_9HYPO|nr:hypothetical protein L249_6787 [Ophiocordyceps polyrhachis-furcata BCC 54312]
MHQTMPRISRENMGGRGSAGGDGGGGGGGGDDDSAARDSGKWRVSAGGTLNDGPGCLAGGDSLGMTDRGRKGEGRRWLVVFLPPSHKLAKPNNNNNNINSQSSFPSR